MLFLEIERGVEAAAQFCSFIHCVRYVILVSVECDKIENLYAVEV